MRGNIKVLALLGLLTFVNPAQLAAQQPARTRACPGFRKWRRIHHDDKLIRFAIGFIRIYRPKGYPLDYVVDFTAVNRHNQCKRIHNVDF